MRNIGTYLFLLTIVFLLFECSSTKEMGTVGIEGKTLSEQERSEYNYALTEATKQKIFGNFEQAAILYYKCIEVNPYSDVAYFQLGSIYMILRDLNKAKIYTRRAAQIEEKNYWYLAQLAQIYSAVNELDSALITFQKMEKLWPDKIEVQFEIARIYSEKGSYDKALKLLNKIEKENGISEPVSMLKEQIYIKNNKHDKAVEELKKLLNVNPGEIKYMGILAELYSSIGENDKAQNTYEQIFKIEPENTMALLSYAEFNRAIGNHKLQFEILTEVFRNETVPVAQKIQVLIELLTAQTEANIFNTEIGNLIKVLLEKYPHDYRVRTAYADYLVNQGDYEEALKEYEYVLSVEKRNYFIWEQSIFIENTLGNHTGIYNKSKDAIKLFPDKPLLYLFGGNAAMQLNKNDEAIRMLNTGIGLSGNNNALLVQFYSFLAECYHDKGENQLSDEYFEKSLELNPDNLVLLNNYSYYLALRNENLDRAKEMSQRTIAAEPENATYLDTYAWILYMKKNYKKALEFIEKALQYGGGNDPDILDHYGDILEKLGRIDEAKEIWIKSVSCGNKNENVLKKIENAEKND